MEHPAALVRLPSRDRVAKVFHEDTCGDLFMRTQTARTDTADRMLDLAERLVQTRGFNGFSYADIYAGVLRNERMCLCGMLAADYATLPEPMKSAVTRFFEANERWLAAVLEQGRAAGDLQFAGPPLEVARLLVSSLEGAMLVARSFSDVSRFQSIADRLLTNLSTTDSRPAPSASRS